MYMLGLNCYNYVSYEELLTTEEVKEIGSMHDTLERILRE